MNLKLESVGLLPKALSRYKFVDTNMLPEARSNAGALPYCLRLSAISPFPNAYIPKPRYNMDLAPKCPPCRFAPKCPPQKKSDFQARIANFH